MDYTRYKRFEVMNKRDRKWPNNEIENAPIWCSVDLRDGNQALEIPMTLDEKLEFFKYLVDIGFKEIEIGFPAASDTEFEFARRLIEDKLIPDDVTVQVLTQSREHIIQRTFEALEGVNKAIVHLYNSTSTLQREVVFNKSKEEIKEIAVSGAKTLINLAEKYGKERFRFEYSPESFTGTEMDYAVDVLDEVTEILKPTKENKVIYNLPSTVEMSTPNVYADQIEYVCENIKKRDCVIISLHAHNDRGTAIAATELAMLAGADRVEGTLFGNGERTGNADILNLAMNLYSQGIDPKLDFSKIDETIDIYEKVTKMSVHDRHPYAGNLVFTAFSGSHQDAINKGMVKMKDNPKYWEVPYLPIDPKDLGRNYDPIIRINSQSGKGGVAYVLENNYGLHVPKVMQPHFSLVVTRVTDQSSKEMLPSEIYDLFTKEYINISSPFDLIKYKEEMNGISKVHSIIKHKNAEIEIDGEGNGVIDAFCNALSKYIDIKFEVVNYNEHSLEYGSKSRAITYVKIKDDKNNEYFGAGVSSNITKASLKAIVSAVNKMDIF